MNRDPRQEHPTAGNSSAGHSPEVRQPERNPNAALPAGHMDSVEAVQRAILDGMKRGGRFGRCHKEGGTDLFWRQGQFVRSDYGDSPGMRTFRDEGQFLRELWHFCQYDLLQGGGGRPLTELEAWKRILGCMSASPSFPGGGGSHTTAGKRRPASAVFAAALGLLVLLLVGGGLAAWKFVTIQSTGIPLGPAWRSSTLAAQLLVTQERHLPRLHRNPSRNRYRIDLLAIPFADPSRQHVITLIRQQQANAMTPMTKILGADGGVLWVQALELFAVNPDAKRVRREADLRKANPGLELFLASARPEFTDRLVLVSPDRSLAYAIAPDTLKASACPPPARGGWMDEQRAGRLEASLCSGGLIASNEWIAVATAEDARSDFKTGLSLPREFTAGEKDQPRHLYGGRVDASGTRPRIETSDRLGATEYRAASFLRAQPGGGILKATSPASVFLIHRVGTALFASQTLTRLGLDGREVWNAVTGIGRLGQVLPGPEVIVLVGERPPEPDQVPEPILVLVDTASGGVQTVSLWRRAD